MKNLSFIAAAAAFRPIVEAEYNAALAVHEDNPRLNGLGDLGNLIAACLAEAPAQSLQDMAAKALVLKIQLPDGRTSDVLWDGADAQERLAWSMSEDALRLAAQTFKIDPVLAACEAYHRAREAVNAFEGEDTSPASAALWRELEEATAAAYRTKPTTPRGVHAFLEVLLSNETGCMPDLETQVAMDTLRGSFAELDR